MRNFKKFLALVLAVMMVVGGMVTVSAAEEKSAADYSAAANALADLGIVKGTSDDVVNFDLDSKVVRFQQALLFARIMTGEVDDLYWSTVENTAPFGDVTNYFGAIAYVAEQGVVNGYPDGNFGPEDPITYQDALTMAVRSLGYKQLVYPTGFVNTAKQLGLTAGLESGIGMEQQLTRGQMFQIIYNTLYAADRNDKSFAEKNFGLQSEVYVLVATNWQYMVGAERTVNPGYVKLAKLNADGSYNFDKTLHFKYSELGLSEVEAEQKLGFSYTVRSYTKYADILDVVENDTKVFQNYGDLKTEIKSATNALSVTTGEVINIGGTNYRMVKNYSNLNNKSIQVGQYGELIVHSMFESADKYNSTYYLYDLAGNIVDEQGNVVLYYNRYFGGYYVKVVVGTDANGQPIETYREATDADFAKYAVNIYGTSVNQYGVITNNSKLNTIKFSQITMIDDNGDGVYDRAIYVPYSVGQYTAPSETNTWILSSSSSSGSTKKTVSKINGAAITGIVIDKAGSKWSSQKLQQSDIRFVDLNMKSNRPANNDYVVYYYNPYARVFTLVENLGTPVSGKVQSMSQGTYAYDGTSQTYYYNNATVTVDGKTYVLGYRDYVTNKQHSNDLLAIDANLAKYGYSETVYASLLANQYKSMSYLVLANRIIKVGSNNNDCGWMVFDYGEYTTKQGGGLTATTHEYTGDIIGVDEAGNILVQAYVDKTGEPTLAKIASINGYSYGLLVTDYAALNYQFSGIGILGNNALDTMKKIVICDFFKTLTADVDDPATTDKERQLAFIVTGKNDNGAYEIYTDLNLYWGDAGMPYRQPAKMATQDPITFVKGISTALVRTDAGTGKVLALNADSLVLVVAKDGIFTYTGVPVDNATLDTKNTTSYTIANNFIFVASPALTHENIFYVGTPGNAVTPDSNRNANAYNYYMVVGDSSNNKYQGNTWASASFDGANMVYTYTNLYNINTGNFETKAVVNGLKDYQSTSFIGNNAAKPLGAIYAERNGVWTLLTTQANATINPVLGTYKYAVDSASILEEISTGSARYAGVYKNVGTLGAASANGGYSININGTVIPTTFVVAYDVLAYTWADGVMTSILLTNNRTSNNSNSGAKIYYTWGDNNSSFVGLAVTQSGTTPDQIADAAAVARAITDAKAALNNELSATPGANEQKAYDDAVKAIEAAKTVAAVNAALEAGKTAIAAGKVADDNAAADATLKAAVAAAQAALDQAYNNRADVVAAKAVYDRLTAELKAAAITLDRANVIKANGPAQITEAIAAFDQNAAETFKGITSLTANVVTLNNVYGITAVSISAADANGYFTKAVGTVTFSGSTATTDIAGVTAVWTQTSANGRTLTLSKVDAAGQMMPVFTAGTTYNFNVTYTDGTVANYTAIAK